MAYEEFVWKNAGEGENTPLDKTHLNHLEGGIKGEEERALTSEDERLKKAENLKDLVSAATARTNLGLGTAAVEPATAFDAHGEAAAEKTRAEAAEALKAPLASPTFTGTVTAPELSVSGLTGATQASRYVGATASGAPTTGVFAIGDFVIDRSGKIWVCTAAGTPGTWAEPSAVSVMWGITNMYQAEAEESKVSGISLNRGLPQLEWYATTPAASVIAAIDEQTAWGVTPVIIVFGDEADEKAGTKLSAWETAKFATPAVELINDVEAARPGVALWELLNEPYYIGGGSDAADYARLIEPVLAGVASTARLIVCGWGSYSRQDETFSNYIFGEGWLGDMVQQWGTAKPTFTGGELYWSHHPYGSASAPAALHYYREGIRSLEALHTQAVALGLTGAQNWLVTEFGWRIAEAPAKEEEVSTREEQAARYEEALERMWEYCEAGWLRGILAYRGSASGGWEIAKQAAGAVYVNFAAAHQT